MRLIDLRETTKPTRQGTYAGVSFSPDTIKKLIVLQERLKVPNPIAPDKFHSTLLYSRKLLPNYIPLGEIEPVATSDDVIFELEIWPSDGGSKNLLVLKYDCAWLTERHETLMIEHEATWDFPDYSPHITLSYDVGDWLPEKYAISFNNNKPIVITAEYEEALNLEWSA